VNVGEKLTMRRKWRAAGERVRIEAVCVTRGLAEVCCRDSVDEHRAYREVAIRLTGDALPRLVTPLLRKTPLPE